MIRFWIIVADAAMARIFEQCHPDKDPVEIEVLQDLQGGDARFSSTLCKRLSDAVRQRRFDKLFIAASPAMLGLMRRQMAPEVDERLVGQVDKDLRHMGARQLGQYVGDRLAQPH